MLLKRYISAVIYLVFITISALPTSAACAPVNQSHSCCCNAGSSCSMGDVDMGCCNVDEEEDDQTQPHALAASISFNQTFLKSNSEILSLISFPIGQNESSSASIEPPPKKVKFYLAIHKLLFYA